MSTFEAQCPASAVEESTSMGGGGGAAAGPDDRGTSRSQYQQQQQLVLIESAMYGRMEAGRSVRTSGLLYGCRYF